MLDTATLFIFNKINTNAVIRGDLTDTPSKYHALDIFSALFLGWFDRSFCWRILILCGIVSVCPCLSYLISSSSTVTFPPNLNVLIEGKFHPINMKFYNEHKYFLGWPTDVSAQNASPLISRYDARFIGTWLIYWSLSKVWKIYICSSSHWYAVSLFVTADTSATSPQQWFFLIIKKVYLQDESIWQNMRFDIESVITVCSGNDVEWWRAARSRRCTVTYRRRRGGFCAD